LGTITGNVTNQGTVNVGQRIVGGPAVPLGRLVISGNYTQTGTGELDLRILASQNQQYDQLFVTGTATLDGDLFVTSQPGFAPAVGDVLRVLIFGNGSGDFRRPYHLPTLPAGRTWGIALTASELDLTVQ
jgi:hypothetical protein